MDRLISKIILSGIFSLFLPWVLGPVCGDERPDPLCGRHEGAHHRLKTRLQHISLTGVLVRHLQVWKFSLKSKKGQETVFRLFQYSVLSDVLLFSTTADTKMAGKRKCNGKNGFVSRILASIFELLN